MNLNELKDRFSNTESKYSRCGGIFDFDSKDPILAKLRKKSTVEDFWTDNNKASAILKKISIIEKELELWKELERRHSDLEVLFEFAESDESQQ